MMGSRRKGGRRDDPAPPLSEDSMLRASAHERERTAGGRALPPGFDAAAKLIPVLGRIGPLEVRLATTAKEIRRAQRLRFKVFYGEMSAVPNGACLFSRRDV